MAGMETGGERIEALKQVRDGINDRFEDGGVSIME